MMILGIIIFLLLIFISFKLSILLGVFVTAGVAISYYSQRVRSGPNTLIVFLCIVAFRALMEIFFYNSEKTLFITDIFLAALIVVLAILYFGRPPHERTGWWYYGFFRNIPDFFSRFGFYIIFLVISILVNAAAVWHIKAYKHSFPHMTGMMIGMTIGMTSGFSIGLVIGATNGFFIGSLAGLIIGMAIGSYTGNCCGIMGIMEGMMAGLMGGIMGAI